MSLSASQLRTAFGVIKARIPDALATVQNKGQTCTGILLSETDIATAGIMGEEGVSTSGVRVDMSELTQPTRGETILVNGAQVFAMEIRPDPLRALMVITFQDQEPAELV